MSTGDRPPQNLVVSSRGEEHLVETLPPRDARLLSGNTNPLPTFQSFRKARKRFPSGTEPCVRGNRLLRRRTIAHGDPEFQRKNSPRRVVTGRRILDIAGGGGIACPVQTKRWTLRIRALGRENEAHVSAQQSSPQEDPRISQAHEYQGRPGSSQAPSPKGPDKARRVTVRRTFTPTDRVRKRNEYQRVYEQGHRISSKRFTLFYLENGLGRARLGMTISRRAGGAVQRNRAKRLLREWFRESRENLPSMDLVVNAREGIHRASLDQLSQEMKAVFHRLASRGSKP